MQLSFINTNWYRKYPFKATTDLSYSGIQLPTDIIVGARLMTDSLYPVYITKIWINNLVINIELTSNNIVIGYCTDKLQANNQALTIKSLSSVAISGFITIGNIDNCVTPQFYALNAELEPSTITLFNPPAIKGIEHNGELMTGIGTIQSSSLAVTTTNNINIAVITPDEVASRLDRTSQLLTCNNPIISGINTVKPNLAGNIDVYGIHPVRITVTQGVLTIDTEEEIGDLCSPVNIPPIDTSNIYFEDIVTTTTTEWQTWPQFNV